jgi:hypothetical protein
MVKKILFFFMPLYLNAMEIELHSVKIEKGAPFSQQAEFLVDVYFNGKAETLKPQIVRKLTKKIEESPHRDSISLTDLKPKVTENVTPHEKVVLEYADQLLATTLHEVLADKEVEVREETRKKKYAMIAAIAGGLGTLGTALAAVLTHVIGEGCLDCVDECSNITQSG